MRGRPNLANGDYSSSMSLSMPASYQLKFRTMCEQACVGYSEMVRRMIDREFNAVCPAGLPLPESYGPKIDELCAAAGVDRLHLILRLIDAAVLAQAAKRKAP